MKPLLKSIVFCLVLLCINFTIVDVFAASCIKISKNSGFEESSLNFGEYYPGDTTSICITNTFENTHCRIIEYPTGYCDTVGQTCDGVTSQVTRTISGLSQQPSGSKFSISGSFPATVNPDNYASGGDKAEYQVCFNPGGSGSDSGIYTFNISPTPNSNSFTVSATRIETPTITTSSPIDLGSIPAGDYAEDDFILRNRSPYNVTISSFSFSSLVNCSASIISPPSSISAGDYTSIDFEVSPNGSGSFSGTIQINTPDPYDNPTISFSGEGTGSLIDYSGETDFGYIQTGYSTSNSLTLYNNGSVSITINNTSHTSDSYSDSNIEGMSIPAGGSISGTVSFSPTINGEENNQMSIETSISGNDITIDYDGVGSAQDVVFIASNLDLEVTNGESEKSVIHCYSATSDSPSLTVQELDGNLDSFSYSAPSSIPSFSSAKVEITYDPSGGNEHYYDLRLSAGGVTEDFHFTGEVFPAVPGIDIFWLILSFIGLSIVGFFILKRRNKMND